MPRPLLLLALSLLAFLPRISTAQLTRVRGKVLDAESGEPLPYITVSVKGQTVGTITNERGVYFLETCKPADTLLFASVGYESQQHPVQRGKFNKLNISLQPSSIQMEAVVVTRERNPALPVLDSVIAHKARNNPKSIPRYKCRVYNKIQLDINNVDSTTFQAGFLQSVSFLNRMIDTNAMTGKSYLPVMMSEAISDYYYQRSPRKTREVIRSSLLSGVEQDGLDQFTGELYQEINIYENYTSVFNQGLVSPIHDNGPLYYRYFLVDSAQRDGHKEYQISFRPRRQHEPCFRGYMWIDTRSYAIRECQYTLDESVNLNFVHYLMVKESFQRVGDSVWFPEKRVFFMDMNIASFLANKSFGVFGRKTTLYDSVQIGEAMPSNVARDPHAVIVMARSEASNSPQWDSLRPEGLTAQEEGIYRMVDTVKTLPIYTRGRRVVEFIAKSYLPLQWFEVGPFYKFYSQNPIEGHRIRLGARTRRELSEQFRLGGYVAYGFGDGAFKWDGTLDWLYSRHPWRKVTLNAQYDMLQLGADANALLQDNALGTLLRRERNYMLTPERSFSLAYEHDVFAGLLFTAGVGFRTIYSTANVPFREASGRSHGHIVYPLFEAGMRWRHKEKYLLGSFERNTISSEYPELILRLKGTHAALPHSDVSFLQIFARIRQKVMLHPIGYSWFILGAGQIFGDVPFPLLKLHEGSGTYGLARFTYNMLDYYELASDRWASLMVEHHFQGLLFNHIPLLRKLDIREVVSAKALIGDARAENLLRFAPPASLRAVGSIPYVELSAGVENILHFLRVDAVWRLTHNAYRTRSPFGVRFALIFQF